MEDYDCKCEIFDTLGSAVQFCYIHLREAVQYEVDWLKLLIKILVLFDTHSWRSAKWLRK